MTQLWTFVTMLGVASVVIGNLWILGTALAFAGVGICIERHLGK